MEPIGSQTRRRQDDLHHDDPLVSVIVLSYNRPQFLRESLEYIYKQSYRNFEVLLMDNGSSCPEQIRDAVAAFPGAKLYMAKTNVGYTGGMNAGVAFAKGKYVYLTEDDMFSEPDCIERLVRYAESDPSAAIVSGSIYSREDEQLICCGGQVSLTPIFSWVLYNQTTGELPCRRAVLRELHDGRHDAAAARAVHGTRRISERFLYVLGGH